MIYSLYYKFKLSTYLKKKHIFCVAVLLWLTEYNMYILSIACSFVNIMIESINIQITRITLNMLISTSNNLEGVHSTVLMLNI